MNKDWINIAEVEAATTKEFANFVRRNTSNYEKEERKEFYRGHVIKELNNAYIVYFYTVGTIEIIRLYKPNQRMSTKIVTIDDVYVMADMLK